ncbi:MAG: response regulator transcription factor [Anaerolineae bacterium]|jgi:DNA-binding NarL/FixJ family response regulator|uniref:response regulator transcription factor n=1 Tax=Candidatus Flexifilum breve TaxID=3140694 RepID=UPI001AC3A68D|nr:response regulator transcription factor [Chloroflexota bacterium]MBK9749450.1 response regulator transcription factor [Chloroflexota bacterium]MBN8636066.1 response regulator transcription factor [Anaerolineae bacterium]
MTRLLLVEDHVLVRQSIRAFLEGANFEVVGEASSGAEAVQLATDLQPDLIIMDVHLPEMSGIEATRRIRRALPDVRVVALTAYNEKAYQRAFSEAGADGFVLKTSEFSELLKVIQTVIAAPRDGAMTVPQPESASPLTERELEVLVCAARGWTNKQIGVHLNISDRTVQVHLQAIYQKLDVTNRTEMVLRALTLGIIHQNDEVIE